MFGLAEAVDLQLLADGVDYSAAASTLKTTIGNE